MRQKIVVIFATVVLLLGMSACTDKSDTTVNQQEMEKNLVGLWYEDFDYKDVTEDGKPFNHAMIAVEAKADHTGYIALAVFDDEFNEPLEVYGGLLLCRHVVATTGITATLSISVRLG